MSRKDFTPRSSFVPVAAILVLVVTLLSVRAFAGSAVVGSVAGSRNATLGGEPLLPSAVVFSGDSLRVGDGATVIALSQGSRLVFGRETQASFSREGNEVTLTVTMNSMGGAYAGVAAMSVGFMNGSFRLQLA